MKRPSIPPSLTYLGCSLGSAPLLKIGDKYTLDCENKKVKKHIKTHQIYTKHIHPLPPTIINPALPYFDTHTLSVTHTNRHIIINDPNQLTISAAPH